MHRRVLVIGAATLAGIAATALSAQEASQQDRAPVTVPAYTDQQRWNRTMFHFVSFTAAGISYAKSRGATPEEYGRFLGGLVASSWGPPNSGYALRMARGVLFNFAALPGADAQMVGASDTSATLRYRRVHVPRFGTSGQLFGVTVDEFDRAITAAHERIASHLGLRYEQRVDGEWNVVTLRGRGSAAAVGFPRATYAVSFAPSDTGPPPPAGSWEVTYGADGRYTVRQNGEAQVQGAYEIRWDEISLREDHGPLACSEPAVYRWNVSAQGQLVLNRLSDACERRSRFIARQRLTRK